MERQSRADGPEPPRRRCQAGRAGQKPQSSCDQGQDFGKWHPAQAGDQWSRNGCFYGSPSWRSVGQTDVLDARFVQVGTYNKCAFVSGSDDGRGCGSVFLQQMAETVDFRPKAATSAMVQRQQRIAVAAGPRSAPRPVTGSSHLEGGRFPASCETPDRRRRCSCRRAWCPRH